MKHILLNILVFLFLTSLFKVSYARNVIIYELMNKQLTENAKIAWQKINTPTGGRAMSMSVNQDGFLAVVSGGAFLYVSKDSGKTFEYKSFASTFFDNNPKVHVSDLGNIYLVLDNKTFVSRDEGETFEHLTDNSIIYVDQNEYLFSVEGELSFDKGVTWNSFINHTIRDFAKFNNSIIFVDMLGRHIYYSDNNGLDISNITTNISERINLVEIIDGLPISYVRSKSKILFYEDEKWSTLHTFESDIVDLSAVNNILHVSFEDSIITYKLNENKSLSQVAELSLSSSNIRSVTSSISKSFTYDSSRELMVFDISSYNWERAEGGIHNIRFDGFFKSEKNKFFHTRVPINQVYLSTSNSFDKLLDHQEASIRSNRFNDYYESNGIVYIFIGNSIYEISNTGQATKTLSLGELNDINSRILSFYFYNELFYLLMYRQDGSIIYEIDPISYEYVVYNSPVSMGDFFVVNDTLNLIGEGRRVQFDGSDFKTVGFFDDYDNLAVSNNVYHKTIFESPGGYKLKKSIDGINWKIVDDAFSEEDFEMVDGLKVLPSGGLLVSHRFGLAIAHPIDYKFKTLDMSGINNVKPTTYGITNSYYNDGTLYCIVGGYYSKKAVYKKPFLANYMYKPQNFQLFDNTLIWQPDSLNSYSSQLQISKDQLFDEIIIDQKLVQTHFELNKLSVSDSLYARVRTINDGGVSEWSVYLHFIIEEATHVMQDNLPNSSELQQNYPNPFNPSTIISYSLPEQTNVRIDVFNSLGQRVAILVDESKSAGRHEVTFDAKGLSSGLYLYRLTTPEFTQTRVMNFIK